MLRGRRCNWTDGTPDRLRSLPAGETSPKRVEPRPSALAQTREAISVVIAVAAGLLVSFSIMLGVLVVFTRLPVKVLLRALWCDHKAQR